MTKSITLPLAVILLLGQSAAALQINVTYDTNGLAGSIPGSDPSGARLMALAQAAATYWEDIIKDPHTLDLTIRYDNGINPGFIGLFTETAESGGRLDSGIISIRGSTVWYYDSTPTDHSEYTMGARLYRNAQQGDPNNFTGNVPGVLEINFAGGPALGAPPLAQSNTDLFTTLLHEMGHALGMSTSLAACAAELQDNDFDFNPAQTNGNVVSALLGGTTGAHVNCQQCVMNPGIPVSLRRLPSAGDVLALATCPNPGWTQIDLPRKDFLPGGTTVWNTAANWIGGRLPDAADDAFLRYGIDVPGDPLISLSGAGVCGNLLVANATRLRTMAHKLDVAGTVTVAFDGNLPAPEIFVESSGELEATDVILNGGEVDLTGGLLDIADDLLLSDATSGRLGILTGYGTVQVDGTLRNDGRIDAGDGQTLLFSSPAATPWDLDGADGNGEVLALLGNLNFASGAMTDAFDGLLQIEDPHIITLAQPWTLGSGGLVKLNGGDPSLATLAGGLISAATGDIQVSGRSRISAPVNFGGALELVAAADAHLSLDGAATVNGGGYLLGANAVLEFNNTTTVSGGAFLIPATAMVRFDAPHTLTGGSFSGSGTLALNGALTTVDSAVTILCATLDLDGPGGARTVQLNAPLTIHSGQIDLTNNQFDAGLRIAAAPAALHVNGPASWIMAGTLEHTTGSLVFATSLSGAPVTVSGTVNVSGSTRWEARASVSGSIALPGVLDRLELRGGTAEEPNRLLGGTVSGNGSLRATSAHLTGFGSVQSRIDFQTGSSLLANDGVLSIGGTFLSVPPVIGTADSDGILEVVPSWTLPAGKNLSLNGGLLRGGSALLQGGIVAKGTARLQAVALFDVGSSTTIDAPGDMLRLEKNATIRSGAVFSGAGQLLVADNSTLTLDPLVNAGVAVGNEARIEVASGPGKATVAGFTQSAAGTLSVEIPGAPASADYDQLTVTGTAALGGRLEVLFNVPGAQAGDTWKVLAAGALSGSFAQIAAAGVPVGYQLLPLQTADGFYLKLSRQLKYAEWALAAGLTPPDDSIGGDPDNDGIANGLEMFLGGHPLKPEPSLLPSGGPVDVDGKPYLSITLPVWLNTLPSDLQLRALRSTDLGLWKEENTVVEVLGYDPAKCQEFRRFRSALPIGSLAREFLRVEAIPP